MSRSSAVLCIALTAFGAGCRSTPKWARVDPALATLVPPATVLMAGIRVDRLKETPAWKQHIAERPIPLLDEAARETGLDLRRDLWEVTIVSDGSSAAALARGKFAEQGMEPRVSPQARRMPYKGHTLLGNERAAVVLLNPTTAVAGKPSSLMWIIDERGKSTGPPARLTELLGTIRWENQVWLVASGAVNMPGNAANLARMLGMAETAKAALKVDSGADLNAELSGRSDQDAATMEQALRGLSSLARVATRDPDMQHAFEGVQIARAGRNVTVQLSLTAPQLAKLLD